MNHRSKRRLRRGGVCARARGVHVSYAVGEWGARPGRSSTSSSPLGPTSFDGGFREPLYHTVLERYVQLITRQRA